MVYAMVSDADNGAVSYEFFGSKKVPVENICRIEQLGSLAQVIKQGDTVWVVDVNRFGSVGVFWNFYQMCKSKRVSLKFLATPYLNYQPGKEWKSSYEKIVMYLLQVEKKMAGDICRSIKGVNPVFMQNYAGYIAVNVLGQIFCIDGVMNRSSC